MNPRILRAHHDLARLQSGWDWLEWCKSAAWAQVRVDLEARGEDARLLLPVGMVLAFFALLAFAGMVAS